jgi:hypothetical protein
MNTIVSAEEEREIAWDCLRLLTQFYRFLDESQFARLGALLHSQGVWVRQGRELRNAEQIVTELSMRPKNLVVRHFTTNALFEVRNAEHVNFSVYLGVVRADSASLPSGPPPLHGVQSVHVCNGEIWRTTEGWRIGRMDAGAAKMQIDLNAPRMS